ncbi:MAG: ankyrin repeat domain-containing protein [Elusimicrobiota bacterium]|jgi:hypothetical protein|nr:ankyrin repeat domain-containing protein [Elusimicrobiota bacterium]
MPHLKKMLNLSKACKVSMLVFALFLAFPFFAIAKDISLDIKTQNAFIGSESDGKPKTCRYCSDCPDYYNIEEVLNSEYSKHVAFIKFCCDYFNSCYNDYIIQGKYLLSHYSVIKDNVPALRYFIEERDSFSDDFTRKQRLGDNYPIEDPEGLSSPMLAAQLGRVECLDYLLNGGGQANVRLRNQVGQDAMYFAKKSKNQTIINMIQKALDRANLRGDIKIDAKAHENKKKLIGLLSPAKIEESVNNLKKQYGFLKP